MAPANGIAGASAPNPRDWTAADADRMSRVQFVAGVPSVPADTRVPADSAAQRQWIAANPAADNVQISATGIPTVARTQTPAPVAGSLSSTQGIAVDGRVVTLPAIGTRPGGATADGFANPPAANFGNVPINTTVSQNITITVDAGYQIALASGSGISAPFSFSFNTCGAGGGFTGPGTCIVTESFNPTSFTASSGVTNVFECPVGGGSCIPIPFSVSGTGVSVAFAAPAAVNYGNVPINTTVTQGVTITVDTGYQVALATGSGINVPFSFAFDTCGAGGGFTGPGTCNVNESFHPTALATSNGTTNVFECPVAGGSCLPIPYNVSGTGVSVAFAAPAAVNYGNVPINTTVTQGVTITVDTGYQVALATGSGINVPFSFAFDTCGAGGGFTGPGTCNVNESFHPTALATSNGTTNVFECPVAGGSCLPIPYNVSGTGISVASANPGGIDFGDVAINTTVLQHTTLTVDAGYSIQIASGSGINPPFIFGFGNCGGYAGPGTCVVDQSFHPTSLGSASGSTSVFECPIAGGSCIPIPYAVKGNGIPPTPVFQGAASRRVHGAAGTFDLPLSLVPTNPTTEPRQGPAQAIVFTFDKPIASANAAVIEGAATAGAPTFSGNDVVVPLTGVADAQYLTVTLGNVGSVDGGTGGAASVRVGFLLADVTQNRVVTVADLGLVNAQLSQPVTAANFLKDVNTSGAISVADKGITNASLTHSLPPP